jgi:hypothetical protein
VAEGDIKFSTEALTKLDRLRDSACMVLAGKPWHAANGKVQRQAKALVDGFLDTIEVPTPVMVGEAQKAIDTQVALMGNIPQGTALRHAWSQMVCAIRLGAPDQV